MKITVDSSDFSKLAKNLERATKAIGTAAYRSVNKVASKAYNRSRREIVSQVNLTATYVKGRMGLESATKAQPSAVIYARKRPTTLTRYGANQLTRKAVGKRFAKAGNIHWGVGRNGGLLWGANAGAGDKLRGIPPGSIGAGVSVKVKRAGTRKKMRGAFFIPLRAGKVEGGNGMGVFIRTGKGRNAIKHLYGPSVDQVFRGVIKDIKADVDKELRETMLKQVEYELSRLKR